MLKESKVCTCCKHNSTVFPSMVTAAHLVSAFLSKVIIVVIAPTKHKVCFISGYDPGE